MENFPGGKELTSSMSLLHIQPYFNWSKSFHKLVMEIKSFCYDIDQSGSQSDQDHLSRLLWVLNHETHQPGYLRLLFLFLGKHVLNNSLKQLTIYRSTKLTRTVGLRQKAPPNAQQRKGDIRFGENLDIHSSDKIDIQT